MNNKKYKAKWYQENKERLRESRKLNQRRYRLKHPHKSREYRDMNKEKINNYNKEYRLKNREHINYKNQLWREENCYYYKDYYQEHKEKDNKTSKEWRKRNYEYKRIMDRQWKQNNPDKVLKSNLRQIEKDSGILNMDSAKYKWALQSWSQTIKKRDKKCLICGVKDDLKAHHILHKSKYPKLSFNINNGISLCKSHHDECHTIKI